MGVKIDSFGEEEQPITVKFGVLVTGRMKAFGTEREKPELYLQGKMIGNKISIKMQHYPLK